MSEPHHRERNSLVLKNSLARKVWVQLERNCLASLWGMGRGWKSDSELGGFRI